MFNPRQSSPKSHIKEARLLFEPHVSYFDIESQDRGEIVFPFQLMAFTLLAFVGLGIFNYFTGGSANITLIVLWLYCIFSPFYFPGIYHFWNYFKRERQKSLELDLKYHYLTYEDKHLGKKLHFSVDSIASSTIYHSQMFPYGIDYIKFNLKGGEEVLLSSLLISPWELVEDLELTYTVEKKVFNSLPIH